MSFGRSLHGDQLGIGIVLSATSLVARQRFPNPDLLFIASHIGYCALIILVILPAVLFDLLTVLGYTRRIVLLFPHGLKIQLHALLFYSS
jgi:hypothetical protein